MVFGWFRGKAGRDEGSADAEQPASISPTPADGAAAPVVSRASQLNSASAADMDPSIDLARHRFIVFRQVFPPPLNPGLSFYGGVPIGPPGMAWPRSRTDNSPLTFVMQWDATALAAEDATGLLPRDGAVYFFSNLGWGPGGDFCFIHIGGDGRDWAPLPAPADLPPIFRKAPSVQSTLAALYVPTEPLHAPLLLPRWPFVPVGIDYTKSMEGDDSNGEGRRFWTEGHELSVALLRAQDRLAMPLALKVPKPGFERPFPAFPHDWAAVRLVAASALKKLEHASAAKLQSFMPQADAPAREARAAGWRQEALALYDEAAAFPLCVAVPQDRADLIWDRIEQFQPVFWPSFGHVVDEAVNLSFGLGSDRIDAIPAEYVEACAARHRLATLTIRTEYEHEFKSNRGLNLPQQEVSALYTQAKAAGKLQSVRDIWAPPPNRMLGPPRYVQGDVEEFVDEWVLLLEISSSHPIGWEMGDGVLQFLIRPEDLRARRFDRVEVITTGY